MIQSYTGKFPHLGKNVYIADTAIVIGDVTLNDDVSVWPSAVIRGDMNSIVIGQGTNVQDGVVIHVDLNSPVVIGNHVTIGHLAHVHGATIEDEVLIGSASIVLDGAVVKKHALVAAGALVPPNRTIESKSLVAGVPCVVKREISANELQHILDNAKEYIIIKNNYLKEVK